MNDYSPDKAVEGIMKMINDMAKTEDIMAVVLHSLMEAYEAGYATAEQGHEESELS